MKSARYSTLLLLCVMFLDLAVAQSLVVWNRWRVVHDQPPAIVFGYGTRLVLYGILIAIAVYVWNSSRRVLQSRTAKWAVALLFVLLVVRAVVLGIFYPWGARDLEEFVAAKGRVEVVAAEGERYYKSHGRVAVSLADLGLPDHVTTDPWGFPLGYVRSNDGFRVFVRGAPGYITRQDRMARELVREVVVAGQRRR